MQRRADRTLDHVAQIRPRRAKGDRINGRAATIGEACAQMPVAADLPDTHDAMLGKREDRFRTARTIGARLVEGVHQRDLRAGCREWCIEHQAIVIRRIGDISGESFGDERRESTKGIGGDRRARCHGMAAALAGDAGIHGCADCTAEIGADDRAPGARCDARFIDREGESRASEALLQLMRRGRRFRDDIPVRTSRRSAACVYLGESAASACANPPRRDGILLDGLAGKTDELGSKLARRNALRLTGSCVIQAAFAPSGTIRRCAPAGMI